LEATETVGGEVGRAWKQQVKPKKQKEEHQKIIDTTDREFKTSTRNRNKKAKEKKKLSHTGAKARKPTAKF